MANPPTFSLDDFARRRAQQASVLLTTDVWDWYREMLAQHSVFYDEARASWVVVGYDDVERVALDTATFSSQRSFNPDGSLNPINSGGILGMDPPRHRQLRSLIAYAFTPRVIAQLEARITMIVRALLDAAPANGRLDIVDDLAFPLPIIVIAELLGVPAADRDRFRQWSSDGVGPDIPKRLAANKQIAGYFQALIAQRQQDPRDDLVTALIQAEVDGERLPAPDILGTCLLLLIAGHETTTGLISNAVVCLDDHPDAMRQVIAQPEALPQAIEEVLRYRGVVHTLTRVATTDTEFAGHQIQAGELVTPMFAAADLDDAQFPDANRFDIMRTPNRHLGFGYGVHFCLGAPLARLETRIALGELLARYPHLRRDRSVPLATKPSSFIYGLQHVPVTLG